MPTNAEISRTGQTEWKWLGVKIANILLNIQNNTKQRLKEQMEIVFFVWCIVKIDNFGVFGTMIFVVTGKEVLTMFEWLKKSIELSAKMRWLKTIDKELYKCNKLKEEYSRRQYVIRSLIKEYNKIYGEELIVQKEGEQVDR